MMLFRFKKLKVVFYSILKVFVLVSILVFNSYSSQDLKKKDEYSIQDKKKIIYVTKINSSLKIDGLLDEPEWAQCTPSEGFVQQEPIDNSPSSERTVVRVIMNGENIYFGITCYDSEPDKIVSNEMRRDAFLFNNDNIEIFLDTFNDKKNCYYFRTNPEGARYDAMIAEEGKNVNADWNTIWMCNSKKTNFGWTTEISIPFHAIRFKEGLDNWGVNFGREIRRKNERTYWSYIPRALGTSGKYRISLCGILSGLKGLTKGKNIEIIPYAGGSNMQEYAPDKSFSSFEGGVDVLYRLTGNVRADFSFNTDFAQVEADQEVVNTSRFNLFFPEKRTFFLENKGLFQFGDVELGGSSRSGEGGSGGRISSSSSGRSSGYLLYYSRRIGLKEEEEEEVPLYGGTKISGKIGKNSIGFMSMQNREKELSEGIIEPSTNYSTFRIKRDVLRNSSIGLIALNKQSSSKKYNRSFGIDGNFPLTTTFNMGGSFAKTITPDMKGKDYAGTFFTDLKTDVFTWYVKYLNLGDNFNPEMGFVSRENIKSTYTSATLTKWINKYGLRNIRFYSSFNYITNQENVLETRRFSESIYLNFSSSDIIGFGAYHYYEFLPEDDDIKDIFLPLGNYRYETYRIYYSSDHGKLFSGGIQYRFGNYYGGKKRTISPHYHFKPSSHFSMDAFYDYNHVVLPFGYFYSNVLSTRITYMFNPDLYLKTYIQWNDLDNHLSANVLFHYIHKAANNFYLVYNETRNPDTPRIDLKDRLFMIKFVYHLFI